MENTVDYEGHELMVDVNAHILNDLSIIKVKLR